MKRQTAAAAVKEATKDDKTSETPQESVSFAAAMTSEDLTQGRKQHAPQEASDDKPTKEADARGTTEECVQCSSNIKRECSGTDAVAR